MAGGTCFSWLLDIFRLWRLRRRLKSFSFRCRSFRSASRSVFTLAVFRALGFRVGRLLWLRSSSSRRGRCSGGSVRSLLFCSLSFRRRSSVLKALGWMWRIRFLFR